jgi:hypothetical protein
VRVRFVVLLACVAGCGRIAFESRSGDDGGADTQPGDGSPTDGTLVDTSSNRACLSNPAYVTSAGLTNRYREGTTPVTWEAARADCMTDEADLWVVDDLLEMGSFTGDWTGITDAANEGVWRKLDGTIATFLPFQEGEPDGGASENCIRTDSAGFEDRDCTDLRDYVCECPAN